MTPEMKKLADEMLETLPNESVRPSGYIDPDTGKFVLTSFGFFPPKTAR